MPAFEVDLVPAERDELRYAKPVPVGDEDQGRVAVAVAPCPLRRHHQSLDLVGRQVLA